MNLVLLFETDFHDNATATLRDRRAQHLIEILKCKMGDRVQAGLCGGPRGEAEVLSVSTQEVVLRPTWKRAPPRPLGVDLIVALPRPRMLGRSLQHATAMGVKQIALLQSERVEKSYFSSPLLQEAALQDELVLGLEQAGDTILPSISLHRKFRHFVGRELPHLFARHTKLIAHPGPYKTLAALPLEDKPTVVALGPEGGWIPEEVESFVAQGFTPFSLGERILRVENAVSVVLAQVELRKRLAASILTA
jgi:16S rRNA (uracil1498-N3)-methyltransferase